MIFLIAVPKLVVLLGQILTILEELPVKDIEARAAVFFLSLMGSGQCFCDELPHPYQNLYNSFEQATTTAGFGKEGKPSTWAQTWVFGEVRPRSAIYFLYFCPCCMSSCRFCFFLHLTQALLYLLF